MNAAQTHKMANLLKALGEFNRLSLVNKLCRCKTPQNAMCLCDCCDVDASVVSRHLKILAQEGIVSLERKGILEAYGAELVLTDPLEGIDLSIRIARQIVEAQGICVMQR